MGNSYPSGRYETASWIVDRDLFVWGGIGCTSSGCSSSYVLGSNDPVWRWSETLGAWSALAPSGPFPAARASALTWMMRHPVSHQPLLYLYGGLYENDPAFYGDLHVFRVNDELWVSISEARAPPPVYSTNSSLGVLGYRCCGMSVVFQNEMKYHVLAGLGATLVFMEESAYPSDLFWFEVRKKKNSDFESEPAWRWAPVTENDTIHGTDPIYPPASPSRLGSRMYSGFTFHNRSGTLYLFGSRYYNRLDLWRMKLLCSDGNFVEDSDSSCSLRGSCSSLEPECQCYDNLTWGGPSCEDYVCFGVAGKAACDGHGTCITPEVCHCDTNYFGDNCDDFSCFGEGKTDEDACGGIEHGDCVAYDTCRCNLNWTGDVCEFQACNGVRSDSDDVCGGHGNCTLPGFCVCEPEYSRSQFCEDKRECFGIPFDADGVCSSHGHCEDWDSCECLSNRWFGDSCDVPSCEGIRADADSEVVCRGRGECVAVDTCSCRGLYSPPRCDSTVISIVTAASTFAVLLIVIVVVVAGLIGVVCCVVLRRRDSDGRGSTMTLPLLFGEEDESAGLADLHIREMDVPLIRSEDVRIVSHLAAGGSGATVYVAEWTSMQVIAKVFVLSVGTSQDDLDSVTSEAKLMSSLSHPGVIMFYGICWHAPRLSLIIEYCSNGDVKEFLLRNSQRTKELFPVAAKFGWLKQIASAMRYLHTFPGGGIIHRDLKCENVLLTDSLKTKICDFGLSRVFKGLGAVSVTKGIGTAVYMAPEMTLGKDYSSAVDVFAFGVVAYMLLTEDFHPYSSISDEASAGAFIEWRVAGDPSFRPPLDALSVEAISMCPKIASLLSGCWEADSEKRPTFDSIQTSLLSSGRCES